jgi:hypothetical protein
MEKCRRGRGSRILFSEKKHGHEDGKRDSFPEGISMTSATENERCSLGKLPFPSGVIAAVVTR